jgi:hypothetical protein
MPPLHTAHDREVFGLQQQIRQCEIWIDVDADDPCAVESHRSKLAELTARLHALQEKD